MRGFWWSMVLGRGKGCTGMVGRKMHDVNYVANMVRSGRGCATAKNGRTFAVPFRGAKSSQAKQKMQQVVVRVLRDGLYAQRGIL